MKKSLTLCLLFLSGFLAVADHLSAKLLARGKPENTLAGINLEASTPDEVRRKFGPPTKTVKAPNNPGWTGYLWQTANTLLEVEVTKGRQDQGLRGQRHYRSDRWGIPDFGLDDSTSFNRTRIEARRHPRYAEEDLWEQV
jgi:hypothetical protein